MISFTPWWKLEIMCSMLFQTVFLILKLAFSVVIIENVMLLNPSQRIIAVNKLYKLVTKQKYDFYP